MTRARMLGVALIAISLVACGGGGAEAPAPTTSVVPQESQVVVRLDLNGDQDPDLLTLDTSRTPFTIVTALEGAVDTSDIRRGQPIDAAVSDALANYLVDSFGVGAERELEVVDTAGHPVTVTVFE